MTTCAICGRQSSHNKGQDGLLCGNCEKGAEDDDVMVGVFEAMTEQDDEPT